MIHKFSSSERKKLCLDRMSHSKSCSPEIRKVLKFIKANRYDIQRLEQILTLHELFIDTMEMCELLIFLQKRFTLGISLPFTRVLESSSKTGDISKSQMKYIYRRIQNYQDGESFHRSWSGQQLDLRRKYQNSKEGWRTRSHTLLKTKMKPDLLQFSLRVSMKNVLEAVDGPLIETAVLTARNVGYRRLSSALSYIDKSLIERLKICDLSSLNGEPPPNIARTIAEQQRKVMRCLRKEIEESEDKTFAVALLLRVCKHLRRQHNFHSLLTVLLVISEFDEQKASLSSNKRLYFERLMSIYDPSKAYRNYREYFGPDKESAIGCFPIFSRDMFLIFEHNEVWVDGEVNELFLKGVYDQYSTLKRARDVKTIGRVEPTILSKLKFVDV